MSGRASLTSRLNSKPSIKGRITSVISISGFTLRIRSYASSPSPASPENTYPSFFQSTASLIARLAVSSLSARNTFTIYHFFPNYKLRSYYSTFFRENRQSFLAVFSKFSIFYFLFLSIQPGILPLTAELCSFC